MSRVFSEEDFAPAETRTFSDDDFADSPSSASLKPPAKPEPGHATESWYERTGVGPLIGAVSDVTNALQWPVRKAKEVIANAPDETMGGAVLGAVLGPAAPALTAIGQRLAPHVTAGVKAGAAEAGRRTLDLAASATLDLTNIPFLLAGGAGPTVVRPAVRIAADALMAGIQEAGAIKDFINGEYESAAMQQAFALIGMAGLGKAYKEKVVRELEKRSDVEKPSPRTDKDRTEDYASLRERIDAALEEDRLARNRRAQEAPRTFTDEDLLPAEQMSTPQRQPGIAPEDPSVSEGDILAARNLPEEIPETPVGDKGIYENDAELIRSRLIDKDLYDKRVEIDIPEFGKHAAIPTGGKRVSGEIGSDLSPDQAAVVMEELEYRDGFDNLRYEDGTVRWGEPVEFPEHGADVAGHRLAGKQFGYTKESIDAFVDTIKPKETQFDSLVDETARSRAMQFVADMNSGVTERVGKRRVNLTAEEEMAQNYGSEAPPDRIGGGVRQGTGLEGFPETPGELRDAIKKGKGKLYERIMSALREDVVDQHGAEIREYLAGTDAATKAEFHGEQFAELDSVEPNIPDADISFDFGSSTLKALDDAAVRTAADIKAKFRSIARGETFGANLPVELLGDLVKYGAIKIAKGGVKFAQWSADMLHEFGEDIRPHLQDIYNKAAIHAAELKNFNPDDYFNFKRVSLSETEKDALRSNVTQAVIDSGRVQKEKITFAEVRQDAAQMFGEDAARYVQPFQDAATEYRAARYAMRQRINSLNSEIVEMRKGIDAGNNDPVLQAQLEAKERDLSEMIQLHTRIRSEEGRNLAINRMEADSQWDLSFWEQKARKALGLPSDVTLPAEVQKGIRETIAEGAAADKELADAIEHQKSVGAVYDRAGHPLPKGEGTQSNYPTSPDTLSGQQKPFPDTTPAPAEPLPGPRPPADTTPVGSLEGNQGRLPGTMPPVDHGQTLDPAGPVIPGQVAPPPTPSTRGPRGPNQPPVPPGQQLGLPNIAQQMAAKRVAAAQARAGAARAAMARRVTALQRSGWLETVSALRKAGLLTGVKTHLRNIGGNAAFQVLEETKRIPAVVIDMAMSLGTGKRTVQGPSFRAVAKGTYDAAVQAIKELSALDPTGRLQAAANRSTTALAMVNTGQLNSNIGRKLNSGIPWLDKYANFTFETLSAEDRVFKSYAYRRALEEQMKLARVNMPTQQMIAESIHAAEFATFNNKNVFGQMVRSAEARARNFGKPGSGARAFGQGVAFATDLAVPFANTPANVVARMFDYTPPVAAGKASYHAIRSMINGAMSPVEQKAFSDAIGRGLVGSAVLFLGWKLAEKNLATGTSQPDQGRRNVDQAAGRLPGSILIGGKWRQVATVSPTGNLITVGASLQREATKPLTKEAARAGNVAKVVSRTALEQPMLKGMSDVIDFLKGESDNLIGGTAGSFVPTIVADVSSLFDPYLRESRPDSMAGSAVAGIQSRIPGLRNQLPVRSDVLGRPMEQSKLGAVDPTIGSAAKELSDPVTRELVARKISVGDPTRDKDDTDAVFALRKVLAGKLIDERVKLRVRSPGYAGFTDARKKDQIDDAITEARRTARSIKMRGNQFKTEEKKLDYLKAQIKFVQDRLDR